MDGKTYKIHIPSSDNIDENEQKRDNYGGTDEVSCSGGYAYGGAVIAACNGFIWVSSKLDHYSEVHSSAHNTVS